MVGYRGKCYTTLETRAAAVQTRGGRGPRSAVTRKGPRSAGRGHPQEGAVRGPQKTGEAQSAVRSAGCMAAGMNLSIRVAVRGHPQVGAVRGPRSPAEGAVRGP